MAETWKRHKKFISVVGGGGLGVLILYFALVYPAFSRAAADREHASKIEKEVKAVRESDRFRDANDLETLEQEIATLKALLGQVQKDVVFHANDAFAIEKGEDLVAAFSGKRDKANKDLTKLASNAGAAFPDNFGFDKASDTAAGPTPEDMPVYLERLDLIDRASRLAIECGVKKIESFSQGDSIEREMGPVAKGDEFIGRNCVRMVAGGTFEAVMRFLHGLEQRGRYAALLECSLDKAEFETDFVKGTFTLAALHVDLEAKKEVEETEEGPKKPPKKPPKGTWR